MPRSERERPPGPFTDAAHVRRVDFRFHEEGRRQLSDLLAKASLVLMQPCAPPSPENEAALAAAGRFVPQTPAEWIIAAAEEQIRWLLSARKADPKAAPGNPANYRAAIRRLRQTLKPFVSGDVDLGTAAIADWRGIDAALVRREAELAVTKGLPPYRQRELDCTCARIVQGMGGHALKAGVRLSDDTILRFAHAAMDMAGIELPHPDEHPDRLRKRLFG